MASEAKHTPITHDEAREIARRLIHGSFRRDGEQLEHDKRPRFSIPANPDRDDDLRIRDYIEQQKAALAERDAALVAVEGIERFLGIRDGASGLEQIARDIKSGTFPKKSEQTLAEEAEAARLHNLITASIRSGAPGLSETTCSAIAQSVALKIRHAVSSLPTAQVKR